MLDWPAIWGVGQTAKFLFKPILEDLAKDVAKDAAKSYVGQCFKNVFSVIHREPLSKATGLALKELLELIQNELLDADLTDEQIEYWVDDVRRFTRHDDLKAALAELFLDPDYQLDPALFARTWQKIVAQNTLPEDFSWERIAKRFARAVRNIRHSTGELKETFESLAKAGDSAALKELAGLPPDFNLETYREALVERYGNLDFASLDTTGAYYSDVRLWSVFVPQSVRECHEYDPQLLEVPKEHLQRLVEKGELAAEQLAESEKLHDERRRAYVNQPPRPVLEVVGHASSLPSESRQAGSLPHGLVILGDPGSGKSSLLQFLALRWARIDDANLRYTQPLPLLIELRDYNRWECPNGKGFPKYLHEASTWHRLNQQTLKHLLQQPDRVVLLLDGLDEVFDPAERERVVNDIHRFSNDYKHVRIVVTSRTVGYQPARLRNADFRHFMLQDLDKDQIGSFLDKWHDVTFDKPQEAETKRQRLDHAIKTSKSIAQLAGNPLLLTMMAILNRNQKLPDDRVDLYQQCSRLLLHQWDVERTLGEFPGLSAEIGLREKTDILRIVAYAMQTGQGRPALRETNAAQDQPDRASGRLSQEPRASARRLIDATGSNYIDRQTLESLIEDYLHTELRFEQARAVARALVEQLRTRNFILCYLGADSYAFVHRTFLEYFCAADIVHQFNVAKTLSEQDLIALFDAHCRDDDWREVLRLICGQIDEQFVGRIVEHLATRTDLEQWDGVKKLPEFLVAFDCVAETRSGERIERAVDMLTDATFELIMKRPGGTESMYFFADVLLPAIESSGITLPPDRAIPDVDLDDVDIFVNGRNPWSAFICRIHPDRRYVESLANQDEHCFIAAEALRVISARWPDESTRELLTQRTVDSNDSDIRSSAIQALAAKWPDETTRELLTQRAVQDDKEANRRAAFQALAAKWPDETTRELLAQRAVQDDNESPRRAAIQALAENWPDETTRELLAQRAVQDDNESPRRAALQALAEKWPDETTRELLAQRAVQDDHHDPRLAALRALAEKWPDETTRELLAQRAVQDDHHEPRSAALQALAEKWPDGTTRELLAQRAVEDPDAEARGAACSALGKMHSEFGRILPTRDLDGVWSYLDPLKPIPRDHIERAAEEAGIRPDDIDAQVASLSAHLGWDVTRGAEKTG